MKIASILFEKWAFSKAIECMNLKNYLGAIPSPLFFFYSRVVFQPRLLMGLLYFVYCCIPSVLFLLYLLPFISFPFGKSCYVLVCSHSWSFSTTAFIVSPPVLIQAHYSHLNFAMPGVTMLRDAPSQLYLWGECKNFFQKIGQLSVRKFDVAL